LELDKNIGTSARFYAYITEKSYTKIVMYFLDRGAYAPYDTCIATPLTAVRYEMSQVFNLVKC